MFRFGAAHGGERNASIQCDEPAAILHGKREEIDVGNLTRAEQTASLECLRVDNRNIIGPENVPRPGDLRRQQRQRIRYAARTDVASARKHAQKSVLRQRTTGPAVGLIVSPPRERLAMMDMRRIEEREQDIHVEQSAH